MKRYRALGLFSLLAVISCVSSKTSDSSGCYKAASILNRQMNIPCDGSVFIDPDTGSEILVLPGATTSASSRAVDAATVLHYYELFRLDSGTVIGNEYVSITGQRVQGDSVVCIYLEHTLRPSIDFGNKFLLDIVEVHGTMKTAEVGLSVINSLRDNHRNKECGSNTMCFRAHAKNITSRMRR